MDQSTINRAEELFALARVFIKNKAPYYLPIIHGLAPRPLPGLNTMGVTAGMVMYYDPDWVVTCSVEQIAGALIHEAGHVMRDHCIRLVECEHPDDANDAADMSQNTHNLEAGWILPVNKGIYAKDFDFPENLLMEEYYELLQKNKSQAKGGSKGSGQKGEEGQSSPGQGQQKGVGHGQCGGIAGNPRDFEKELDNQIGRSEFEKKAFTKSAAIAAKEYERTHGRGSVPGDFSDILQRDEQKSQVPWQRKLASKIRKASGRIESGAVDFSLAKPSKRSFSRGFPRPGMISRQPEVTFIADTSGSMGKPQLESVIRETIAIFRALGIDTAWFVQADTRVREAKRIKVRDLLSQVEFQGRGGTHFDDALRYSMKLKPRPDIIIYLTDGDGAASIKPQGVDVIWCVVPSSWGRRPDASFGEVIFVEEPKK